MTVRAGQRRVFAARKAGLVTIPVYIVDADEVTAERIVQQMVENDQREALTDRDRAAAFQQLAFEGLSVTAIARRTGTKQKEVKTALAVTENQVSASAIQEHQLTLDQATVLIEFDGDDEIRADLIQVATTDPPSTPASANSSPSTTSASPSNRSRTSTGAPPTSGSTRTATPTSATSSRAPRQPDSTPTVAFSLRAGR